MRTFYRVHSYVTGEFLCSWVDKHDRFLIQKEVKEGYGLICLSLDLNKEYVEKYMSIPWEEKRSTTMRKCYKQYLNVINGL